MRRDGMAGCVGALLALVALAGCPGTLDDPERFVSDDAAVDAGGDGPSSTVDVPHIFAATCADAGCHSSTDKAQGLDLQSDDMVARLLGVPARGGGLLIDPASPTHSVLYAKLTSNPPFGVRMPLGKPALDDTTLTSILSWVTDVASRDAGVGSPSNHGEGGSDAGD
jgi:hypothetical protein